MIKSLLKYFFLTIFSGAILFAKSSEVHVSHLLITHGHGSAVTETLELSDTLEVTIPFTRPHDFGSLHTSGTPVASARLTQTSVAIDEPPSIVTNLGDLQAELAGQLVTLYFKRSGDSPLKGKLLDWSRKSSDTNPNQRPYLILQEGKNIRYIDPEAIEMLQFATISTTQPFIRKLPALDIRFSEKPLVGTKLNLHYTTPKLNWTPTYVIERIDSARLRLKQVAQIENHFADFSQAEVELFTGNPFLNQPTHPNPAGQDAENARNLGTLAAPHSVWVGTHSLNQGEELIVKTDERELPYDPIVFWHIPQNRAPEGFLLPPPNIPLESNRAWDALQFTNPFAYPLAAGSATVQEREQFKVQTRLAFTPVNGDARVAIEPAALIRADAKEGAFSSEPITLEGKPATRLSVNGFLEIGNYRKHPVTIVIDRILRGTVVSATGNPRITGVWHELNHPNAQQQLSWELTLASGEEKKLNYRYEIVILASP